MSLSSSLTHCSSQLTNSFSPVRIRPFDLDAAPLFCLRRQYNMQQLYRYVKDMNYTLLQTSHHNLRYSCHQEDFHRKTEEFLLRTNAYEEITSVEPPPAPPSPSPTSFNDTKVHDLLNSITEQGRNLLKTLYEEKQMTFFHYQQMLIVRNLVRLDYLFFTLDLREQQQQQERLEEKQPFILEQRFFSTLSPLMPICRYLHRLLNPIYLNQIGEKPTVENGADIIERLECYRNNNYLRSTTYFVTLHLQDSYTSIPHQQLLETFRRFLDDYIQDETILLGITKDGVFKLTEFILENQYFLYQYRIYRIVQGGSTALYYYKLLLNIYFYYWQNPLRLRCENRQEIFLRCFNDIFFTWNETKEDLYNVLQFIQNSQTLSLQYDLQIDKNKIHFLDVLIEYDNSTLHTHVYHDWKYEPFILPTLHDSNLLSPWNILRMAIIRAVLTCSRLEDFEEEKQYIEYSFLFHEFSFEFIRQHWRSFFEEFHATDMMTYPDQSVYDDLRQQIYCWHRGRKEETHQRLLEYQKQCIWYIYVPFQGVALYYAKRNPMQFLPYSWQRDLDKLNGIHLEVIGVPKYPLNSIG
ncbi:unnamed protein product [Rotaria sordida]|uniref:Uncharacterized protein n=1 Tax=Rotaria sordida TaxID=392033 RepID=A0A814KGN2_9BILA|nr:unnamed protein product [Rotaria sordida]CAF3924421.1 unnamed protein product [Rotaria sordida]